jgi:hypothetical protein
MHEPQPSPGWHWTTLGVMLWDTREMQRTYISRENRGFRWINEYPFNR